MAKMLAIVLIVFTSTLHAQAFDQTWSPSKVQLNNSSLFVNKQNPQITLQIRIDPSRGRPSLHMNLQDLADAISAYRTAAQSILGLGKFRTESVSLRAVENDGVQALVTGVYADAEGRRFFLYEEQLFQNGKVFITQLSSPLFMTEGLHVVQKTRADYFARHRGIASEEKTEAAAGCDDCKEPGLFNSVVKGFNDTIANVNKSDRATTCDNVKKEKRSLLSSVVGETEYKSWNEQFEETMSVKTGARSFANCVAGFSWDAVKGFIDPWISPFQAAWSAIKASPGAVASLFDKETWKSLYVTASKLPDDAKYLVTSAGNLGAAALSAARDPEATLQAAKGAMARIVNAFLANEVPEFLCLTPEAKWQMICGVAGYVVGSFINPVALFQLLRAGKFTELAGYLRKGYGVVKGGFISDQRVKAAYTVIDGVAVAVSRTAALEGPAAQRATEWAKDPERAKSFIKTAAYDEARAPGVPPLSRSAASVLSRWKDPETTSVLKIVEDAVRGGDPEEVTAVKKYLDLLGKQDGKRPFKEAARQAWSQMQNQLQCELPAGAL